MNKLFNQYKPTSRVKVEGHMTPEGADKAGATFSQAAKIAAVGAMVSTIIFSVGYAGPRFIEALATIGFFGL